MPDHPPAFNFLATGIGSLPFQDVEASCREIVDRLPDMPFWPQLVRRSHLEDMSIQYSEGLPLLEIMEEKRALVISAKKRPEEELVVFYDHFMSGDTDHFAMSRDFAPGFYTLLEMAAGDGIDAPYLKGHTTGPITFSAAVTDLNGNPVLHNPELLEAMTNGLAIKSLWQVRRIEETGKRAVIFLDEPYLSGFGSAFSPVERHVVVDSLRTVIGYLREHSDALIGIHCCGNTDWSMIVEAGPDIINFDAFAYTDYFILYPDDIVRFLEGGGTIAWGIVPTSDISGKETAESLHSRLGAALERVYAFGISPSFLAERSILTPACGMGTMTPEAARTALDLLSRVSRMCRS